MKAVIEFDVESKEDFLRQYTGSSLSDEDWYLIDGAEQKIHAEEILEEADNQ